MDKEFEKGAPVGGIILLFAGILLLLQTSGYLSWKIWDVLWRFWPVLIIISGINLLLRNLNPWLLSLVIATILTGCAIYAYYQTAIPDAIETLGIIFHSAI